jgi:hypothetical protein
MPTLRRSLDIDIVMFPLVFASTDPEVSVWPDTDMGFGSFVYIFPWEGLPLAFVYEKLGRTCNKLMELEYDKLEQCK